MISRSRVSSITKKKMVLAKEDGGSIKYLIYQPDNTSQIFCKKPINFLIDWLKKKKKSVIGTGS